MRWEKFLKINSNEDIALYRAIQIGLVKEDSKYYNKIKHIEEKYELTESSLELLEKLNKELKKIYRGKYRFDFCLDESISPEDIKIRKDRSQRIKMKWLEFNDKLAKLQSDFEKKVLNK